MSLYKFRLQRYEGSYIGIEAASLRDAAFYLHDIVDCFDNCVRANDIEVVINNAKESCQNEIDEARDSVLRDA